jgi:hypothetical protein
LEVGLNSEPGGGGFVRVPYTAPEEVGALHGQLLFGVAPEVLMVCAQVEEAAGSEDTMVQAQKAGVSQAVFSLAGFGVRVGMNEPDFGHFAWGKGRL